MLDIIKKRIRQLGLVQLFCLIGVVFLFFGALFVIITNGNATKTLVWSSTSVGVFPDFIETITHAKTLTPYDMKAIYPPFVYTFCYLCSRFFPEKTNDWSAMGSSPAAVILGFSIFLFVSLVIFITMFRVLRDKYSLSTYVCLLFIVIFSPPYLYMVERGNLVALSMILLLYYVLHYKDDNIVLRELAYISLACAAAMKIWPAVWGILLIRQKNVKACLHAIFYGLLFGIGPFMFMGGSDGFFKMVNNIKSLSAETVIDTRGFGYGFKVNFENYLNAFAEFFKYNPPDIISKVIMALLFVVLFILMLVIKKEWQVVALLSIVITFLPGFSWIYNNVYFIIPLILFFKEEDSKTPENIINITSFLMIFTILPYGYVMGSLAGVNKISIPTFLNNIGMLVLLTSIICFNLPERFNLNRKLNIIIPIIPIIVSLGIIIFTYSVDEVSSKNQKIDNVKMLEKYLDKYSASLADDYTGLSGMGTQESPFIIDSKEDLLFLAYCVEEGVDFENVYFQQMDTIDLSDNKFSPIGNLKEDYYFNGIYDGNGYSITNIRCHKKDTACLFYNLEGTVVNLIVSDSSFMADNAAVITVGKGSRDAYIANCYTNNCEVSGEYAASIADNFIGNVYNCITDSSCQGLYEAGMLTNYNGSDFNNFHLDGLIDIPAYLINEDDVSYINDNSDKYLRAIQIKLNNYNSTLIAEESEFARSVKFVNWNISDSKIKLDRKFCLKGEGTTESPYVVKSVDDLVLFSNLVNSGITFKGCYISQESNIDLSDINNFTPIANSAKCSFKGVYDGKGNTITNLYVLSYNDEDVGLFVYLDGTILNLNVNNAWLGGSEVGVFACHGSGNILNCYGNGILYGYAVGGIAFDVSGKIENCVAFVNFDSTKAFGINSISKKVINCYSNYEGNNTGNDGAFIDDDTVSSLNDYVDRLNTEYENMLFRKWGTEEGLPRILSN